jgi:hypothetical protein
MCFLSDRRSFVRIYRELRTLKRRRWTIPAALAITWVGPTQKASNFT